MKHYYWMSFSKFAKEDEVGNLGAIVLSYDDDLSFDDVVELARSQGAVPNGTTSIAGGEIPEEEADKFPIDRFMTYEELSKRNDVEHVRQPAPICDDCLKATRH